MAEESPEEAAPTFERREAFEADGDGFEITTSAFESTVDIDDRDDYKLRYTVRVKAPTLDGATAGHVGDAVLDGWFETLERRLEDAPKATRANVDLEEYTIERVGEDVHIEYVYAWANPRTAADIAKTFAEYVEGTYVEGIIPGYEYEPPVADLLADASQNGSGGTPL